MFYDAAGRVWRTLYPDGSEQRAVFYCAPQWREATKKRHDVSVELVQDRHRVAPQEAA
jgi:hypothetical protein